ncbi:hypothetical protein BDR26DRAFT_864746, partial [Obelidium mucronatum]
MSSKTGLDGIVSSLVRAASSAPSTVADSDLERYVAAMIAKEAKDKEDMAKDKGIAAYTLFDRKKRLPKPNTRFLNNLVQQTDSHNYDLILQENQRSRELLESVERRRRETFRDERYSRKRPNDSYTDDSNLRQRRNHSSRSRSRSPHRRRYDALDNESDRNDEKRRRRHHSPDSPPKSTEASNPSASLLPTSIAIESLSTTAATTTRTDQPSSLSPLPSFRQIKGRGAVMNIPSSSRLDKYFEADYNPRLDMDNYDDSNLDTYVNALVESTTAASLLSRTAKKSKKESSSKKESKKKIKKKKEKEKKKKKEKRKKSEDNSSDSSSSD